MIDSTVNCKPNIKQQRKDRKLTTLVLTIRQTDHKSISIDRSRACAELDCAAAANGANLSSLKSQGSAQGPVDTLIDLTNSYTKD
jgi:hypothetical protein